MKKTLAKFEKLRGENPNGSKADLSQVLPWSNEKGALFITGDFGVRTRMDLLRTVQFLLTCSPFLLFNYYLFVTFYELGPLSKASLPRVCHYVTHNLFWVSAYDLIFKTKCCIFDSFFPLDNDFTLYSAVQSLASMQACERQLSHPEGMVNI